jgi:hypothetical protein
MNTLLDLRHHSNRPLHQEELRELIILSAIETLRSIRETDSLLIEEDQSSQSTDNLEAVLPGVARDVEGLIFRITNTLKSESAIWESASMYHTILINGDDPSEANIREEENADSEQKGANKMISRNFGRYELALQERSRNSLFELRLKQLRSLVQIPQWERDLKQVRNLPLLTMLPVSSKQISEVVRVSECLLAACIGNMVS